MAGQVYVEENSYYSFDFNKALWSTNQLNQIYKSVQSLLSDVDFVVETDQEIIFLEYKNSKITGAARPEAFIPSNDKYIIKIARKFYDSIIYAMACKKNKKYRYVYILEYPAGDTTTRRIIRNRIRSKLPFELQKDGNIKMDLITVFDVLSIDEWNEHSLYSQFPIRHFQNTNT